MNLQFIQPQVSTVGLIAHYKLWAGLMSTGKVFDYSLNGNAGSTSGTNIAPAYPGFLLNGTDDYIDTSSSFQSTFRSSFSISAWSKFDDGQGRIEYFVGTVNAANQDNVYIFHDEAGILTFLYESDNDQSKATGAAATFTNGQQDWVHIVCTAEADTQLRIYVNGSEITIGSGASGGGDASGVTFADWTSSDNLYIGALDSDGDNVGELAGKIDDVMIFNRVLSASEAKSIYEVTRGRYGV